MDGDIPDCFVVQRGGHKSTESLQSYKCAGEKQQRQMSLDPGSKTNFNLK